MTNRDGARISHRGPGPVAFPCSMPVPWRNQGKGLSTTIPAASQLEAAKLLGPPWALRERHESKWTDNCGLVSRCVGYQSGGRLLVCNTPIPCIEKACIVRYPTFCFDVTQQAATLLLPPPHRYIAAFSGADISDKMGNLKVGKAN